MIVRLRSRQPIQSEEGNFYCIFCGKLCNPGSGTSGYYTNLFDDDIKFYMFLLKHKVSRFRYHVKCADIAFEKTAGVDHVDDINLYKQQLYKVVF